MKPDHNGHVTVNVGPGAGASVVAIPKDILAEARSGLRAIEQAKIIEHHAIGSDVRSKGGGTGGRSSVRVFRGDTGGCSRRRTAMLPLPNVPFFPHEAKVVKVPPPPRFRPAGSDVVRATWSSMCHFSQTEGNTPARKRGIKYEQDVHDHLSKVWPRYYRVHPWILFVCKSGRRYCCPDSIVVNESNDHVVIFEVKATHTSEAWWQLRRLYAPVVEKLYGPTSRVEVVEVTTKYDPATPFPEEVKILKSTDDVWSLEGKFGVLVWKR